MPRWAAAGCVAVVMGCGTTASNPLGASAGTESAGPSTSTAPQDDDDDPQTTSISDTAESDTASTDPSTTTGPTDSTTAGISDSDSATDGATADSTGEGSTSSMSTGMLTASSTGDSTTTGMSNPVGYGDCANMTTAQACITGEGCILDDVGDPTLGVCSDQSCSDVSECPSAPPGGDAVVTCAEITGNADNDCYLDCSNGETCPPGLRCAGGYICVFDVIGADPIGFGDCFNNMPEDACLFDEACLSDTDMTSSVCTEPGCTTAADCPQPPADGNAPVACLDVTGDTEAECVLDCSAAQTCPTGMFCFDDRFCMFN